MTILHTEDHKTLSQSLAQKIENKLQMADALYKIWNNNQPHSIQKALALAPTIIELLERISEDGIDPSKKDQPWDSGVKHIDNIYSILPKIIKRWRKITKQKGELYKIQSEPNLKKKVTKFELTSLKNIAGIEYIECESLREEALAALLKTKTILKDSTKTVSIISDNPQLIKIILSLSNLWNIQINNYFGIAYRETDQIDFLRLIVETVRKNFSPIYLVALLRHKMFSFNKQDFNLDLLISKLENKYLRGVCKYNNIAELIELIPDDDNQLRIFLWLLKEEFKDFIVLIKQPIIYLHNILKYLINLALRLSDTKEYKIYSELTKINIPTIEVLPDSFLQIFDTLLANERFHSNIIKQTQVKIYSIEDNKALESDYIILTGMNEETLLSNASYDIRLIQNIYNMLGENKFTSDFAKIESIFLTLVKRGNLLLTRSSMINGTPQTPSRLLIKLKLIAHKLQATEFYNTNLLQEMNSLHKPLEFIQNPLPAPAPNLENRLEKLSVTQVEKLIRDPYSIYVSLILKLKKLEKLEKPLDKIEFGKFIHKIIDKFAKNYIAGKNEKCYFNELMTWAKIEATNIIHFPLVRTVWLAQLKKLANWIINFEILRRKKNLKIKIYTEESGKIKFPLTNDKIFTLYCKADRIEIASEDVTIIDFKTGAVPTKKDILSGISPQLPLEALIALEKGFKNIAPLKRNKINIKEISYITLGAGTNFGNIISFEKNLNSLIDETYLNLKNLIEFYNNSNTPFLICPNPDYANAYNEYFHIERIEEL